MNPLDQFKALQRDHWTHFAPLQALTTMPGARLVKHARVLPGTRLLDVGCGTGVVAVTAARAGANVTGLDLTPELLQLARSNAETAGVSIEWHEGDVESLPFESGSFDIVTSQFGHMFAPRPEVAVGEMLRVLKPGGTIAFSTWPPELFVGRMMALMGSYGPPPPAGVAAPPLWGDPNVIRVRLGDAVSGLTFDRGRVYVPALSVQAYRKMFEGTGGMMVKLTKALAASDPAKLEEFLGAYHALTAEYFEDNAVRQDFLMTRAIKR